MSINARTTVFLSLGLGFSGQDISSVRRAAEPCEVLHGGQFSVCLFAVWGRYPRALQMSDPKGAGVVFWPSGNPRFVSKKS